MIAVTCGGSATLNFASIAAECAFMQGPARTDEQVRTGFRALQFGRAAARYDEVADVQREMAARLARFCPAGLAPRRVLELGCGTGLFTEQLRRRFPAAWLSASDWSEQMLAACRTRMARLGGERIEYLVLDASGQRDSPTPAFGCDVLASNALVQWFADPAPHLELAVRLLAPGGTYLLATFGPRNLEQLWDTLAPYELRGAAFHVPSQLAAAARDVGFHVADASQGDVDIVYPSFAHLLRAIRDMGGSRYPGERRLGRRQLEEIGATYERRYGCGDRKGVRATWQFFCLRLVSPARS